MRDAQGVLVLVVGPSGAGKDSIIHGAKAALDGDDRFVFVRRTITRPVAAGGENHIPASPENFASAEAAGEFFLSWQAHELSYGIPRSIVDDLQARRCVVANVSRSVIDTARDLYGGVCVVNVTAPVDILAERIAARGREDAASIRQRLARATQYDPSGDDVITLENRGTLEGAVGRFAALLRRYADGCLSAVST